MGTAEREQAAFQLPLALEALLHLSSAATNALPIDGRQVAGLKPITGDEDEDGGIEVCRYLKFNFGTASPTRCTNYSVLQNFNFCSTFVKWI